MTPFHIIVALLAHFSVLRAVYMPQGHDSSALPPANKKEPMIGAKGNTVFYSYHVDPQCESDYFDTMIPQIFVNQTVGNVDLTLGMCQHQTGFNVRYSCKRGKNKYTIYKKVYSPFDDECARPMGNQEIGIFKHDYICKEDMTNGGYMKIHCGDDHLLQDEMPKIPSVLSPQLFNNPDCQLSGVTSDAKVEYPEMQSSWLFLCHAKYSPSISPSLKSPARLYNYMIDVPPSVGQFPGYGTREAFKLRLQRFDKEDTTCRGQPNFRRMLKYPAVVPLSEFPECLPDPLFPGKFYHNAPFSAPFLTPFMGTYGKPVSSGGNNGGDNNSAGGASSVSCFNGDGIGQPQQYIMSGNFTHFACVKGCLCSSDESNSTLPCEWSTVYSIFPSHFVPMYEHSSYMKNFSACSTPNCNTYVEGGICGPTERPPNPTGQPTSTPIRPLMPIMQSPPNIFQPVILGSYLASTAGTQIQPATLLGTIILQRRYRIEFDLASLSFSGGTQTPLLHMDATVNGNSVGLPRMETFPNRIYTKFELNGEHPVHFTTGNRAWGADSDGWDSFVISYDNVDGYVGLGLGLASTESLFVAHH